MAAGGEAEARARCGRLLSLRPSARRIRRGARQDARADLGRVRPVGAWRGDGRAAGGDRHRRNRSGARAPATRWASCSSPNSTGAFEAVAFSEELSRYRDLLEPGQSVVVLVNAEDRPEGINMRIQSVESLDRVMAGLKQIRVFVRDAAAAGQRPAPPRRQGRGRGEPGAAARTRGSARWRCGCPAAMP